MKRTFLFATIASILSINAYADPATITTQDYVDAADALKQDLIDADMMDFDVDWGSGETYHYNIPTVASYDTTNGLAAGEYGIIDGASIESVEGYVSPEYFSDGNGSYSTSITDKIIPTMRVVANGDQAIWDELDYYQSKIRESGVCNGDSPCADGNGGFNGDWLSPMNKGSGIVTTTQWRGQPGQRKIIEESDVPNYQASNLTANQKAIQKISIPTMGAVMAAISNNQVTLPTGTAGNVVTYNSNGEIGGSVATYNGSTTYNASTDASKIAVMSAVQRKMTCNRYLENAAQTSENCLLWNVPD